MGSVGVRPRRLAAFERRPPVLDVSRRIIMPLEGFVRSLAVQEDIVKQLVNAGVLKREEEPPNEERQ